MIGRTAICRLATSTFKGIGCCPGPRSSAGYSHPLHPPGATQGNSASNGWVPFLRLHQNPIWVRPVIVNHYSSDE